MIRGAMDWSTLHSQVLAHSCRVLGQAALVDLGTKGAVAAVLFTGEG